MLLLEGRKAREAGTRFQFLDGVQHVSIGLTSDLLIFLGFLVIRFAIMKISLPKKKRAIRSKSVNSKPSAKRAAVSQIDGTEIGNRIRSVREKENLSQRELARRAGLTHGTIALIEKGKISPSIGSIRKILDSLSMTLAQFFSVEEAADTQLLFCNADLLEVGTGGVSMKQVGRALRGRPLQVLYERYPPGTETAAKPYSHYGEEGGVVVQGSIEVTVGNQRRVLHAGEGYLFPSRLPHRFREYRNR